MTAGRTATRERTIGAATDRRDVTTPQQRELRTHLERVVAVHLGGQRRISSVEWRPSAYRSSFQVEEIDIRLDNGTTLELIAKATAWSAMSPDAHRARPPFLRDEDREHATYESIVSPFLESARYFGTHVDATGVRWLLLERVAGMPLRHRGDFEAWREAARWLARMHLRVGPDTVANTQAAAHLLEYDRRFYECWMHRACAFHEDPDGALSRLGDRYTRVVDRLLAEPTTFIHGDCYPANILVNGDGAGTVSVCPIDWEMAGLGPALIDLACLLSGGWTAEQRGDLAEAYYREFGAHGGDVPSPAHYLRTLDCCLIHLSVRNLGWSPDWSPPPGQAHDWLGDALRLCEKWQL